jgi:hypothetical protein
MFAFLASKGLLDSGVASLPMRLVLGLASAPRLKGSSSMPLSGTSYGSNMNSCACSIGSTCGSTSGLHLPPIAASCHLSLPNQGRDLLNSFVLVRCTPMRPQCPFGVLLTCGAVSVPCAPSVAPARGAVSWTRGCPLPHHFAVLCPTLSLLICPGIQHIGLCGCSSLSHANEFNTGSVLGGDRYSILSQYTIPGLCTSTNAGLAASGSVFATWCVFKAFRGSWCVAQS